MPKRGQLLMKSCQPSEPLQHLGGRKKKLTGISVFLFNSRITPLQFEMTQTFVSDMTETLRKLRAGVLKRAQS